MKKRYKSKIKRKISKFTKGLVSTIIDLILFEARLLGEIITNPAASHSLKVMLNKIDEKMGLASPKKKNAIYNARKEGWIKRDGTLTKEGREKLNRILPLRQKPARWNKKWYLAIFDIPEKMRRKRNILRERLKKLGFGKLQASVWLSSYNYLNNILEIIKFYKLEPYVILSGTDKLGQEESQDLSRRVWKLDEINVEYKKFIQKYSSQKEHSKFELEVDFYSIFKKDPQLPLDLLLSDWKGERAYKLYQKLSLS